MTKHTTPTILFLALALVPANAKKRSQQDICRIAQSAIAAATSNRTLAASRTGAQLNTLYETPALTVMGYARGGFAIITNDDTQRPIVGYSASASFDTTNTALTWYIKAAEAAMTTDAPHRTASIPSDCKASVAHLVETKWNQDNPYWDKCPKDGTGRHCYTGCVATAMAQIMRYYKYPTTGIGRDTAYYNRQPYEVDFAAARYNYDNMAISYMGAYTTAQKLAVATLMYHCGVATSMTYGTNGSGAYLSDAARGLAEHFGYNTQYYGYKDYPVTNNYDDHKWREVVYRELSAGHPILYAGGSNKNGNYNTSYHAFVLDGYDADGNVGVNWGYSGSGDGYFSLDVLECTAYTPSEQYTFNHEMVVVHHPDDGPVDYPLIPSTNINTPSTATTTVQTYDLSGRTIPANAKGIHIANGKKYLKR